MIDSERYMLTCLRYIEANPLRAGMVARPEDYPWSSYRHNAHGEANALLTPHETYRALGGDIPARQAGYRALFAELIEPEVLDTLRDAIQRGWALGSDRFQREIEAALGRPAGPPRRGRPPKAELRGSEPDQGKLI